MTAIKILFGTESGNAELIADDVAETFTDAGVKAEVLAMDEATLDDLAATIVVITSTYGEGELPAGTAPFAQMLAEQRPDLSGVRFAAFGLGDSSYDTYNNAIGLLTAELTAQGARQFGDTGYHDATSGESLSDAAAAWASVIAEAV